MDSIVEFLYYWLLRPRYRAVLDEFGSVVEEEYIYKTVHEARERCGATWGRLPSGKQITTKEVNDFIDKYAK